MCIYQLLAKTQSLPASELKLTTHGAVLQVNVSLVIFVFGCDAVKSLNLGIYSFVLLELIIFLQPACVLKHCIRFFRWIRYLFVDAAKC
ncbi:hypothetical protein AN901_203161 [Pseudomonas syringae pv. theae]|nr:hypothetical protein AN901_203161 [Pseudomonas syringae pv. theae]